MFVAQHNFVRSSVGCVFDIQAHVNAIHNNLEIRHRFPAPGGSVPGSLPALTALALTANSSVPRDVSTFLARNLTAQCVTTGPAHW